MYVIRVYPATVSCYQRRRKYGMCSIRAFARVEQRQYRLHNILKNTSINKGMIFILLLTQQTQSVFDMDIHLKSKYNSTYAYKQRYVSVIYLTSYRQRFSSYTNKWLFLLLCALDIYLVTFTWLKICRVVQTSIGLNILLIGSPSP